MNFGYSPVLPSLNWQVADNLKLSGNFIYQLLQHFQNFTFYISYYTRSQRRLFPQTALTDWRRSLSSVNLAQDFAYDLDEAQFYARSIKVLCDFSSALEQKCVDIHFWTS